MKTYYRELLCKSLLALVFGGVVRSEHPAAANPTGATVVQGGVKFNTQGSQLTIQTSANTFINWQNFNIAQGETTTFVQPSATSLVWNHINDANPSQILGNLNANGYVVLQNQSGFYIGGQAAITAHGLIMTTSPIAMPDLSSGGAWSFNVPPPASKIINYGKIDTDKGGSVFLIANVIKNRGTIEAPEGNVGLYAGKEVLVSDRPDGLGLSAAVTLPAGSVDNTGKIIADAGTIAMNAQVVNQGGLLQANSVREVGGTIELIASDAVNLGKKSVIDANGDSQNVSDGGSVTIKSSETFTDQPTSSINISGGANGGNGGQVEISAPRITSINSQIDGHAASGFTAGKLSIDPDYIVLVDDTSATQAPSSGTVNPSDPPSAGSADTLTLDINSFNSLITKNMLSQINLQANLDIELSSVWNIPDSSTINSSLTLNAGRNIIVDDGAGIQAGKNWSLNLTAGTVLPANTTPTAGNYGIYLNGNAFLATLNGSINLSAANEVQVNYGDSGDVGNSGVRTTGGGAITVTTTYGDVNAGVNAQGFSYKSIAPFYTVSQTLGGISTAAGGDVTISAGGSVYSYLPTSSTQGSAADAGTGAFGGGDVTITAGTSAAGGSVFGHYVLANGTGTITANQDIGGPAAENVALSLITGSWTLNANRDIYLQEVRNPNGVFNDKGTKNSAGFHFFNYDASDSVSLNAGDAVYLTDSNIPRNANEPVPVLYPPTLEITAGKGGVILENNVTLYPSTIGDLDITTTDSGNLVTQPADTINNPDPELIMSDSDQTHWFGTGTFSDTDHGTKLLESQNPDKTPITLTISGSMENFLLLTTAATSINVTGDMLNCGFSGQNLSSSDTTTIKVDGQIKNDSPYTFLNNDVISIPSVPNQNLPPGTLQSFTTALTLAIDPVKLAALTIPVNLLPDQLLGYVLANASLLGGNPGFLYDPGTGRLGYTGAMSPSVQQALDSPLTLLRLDANGFPVLDANGKFVADQLTWVSKSQIDELAQNSAGAPSAVDPAAQLGYRIGGAGNFVVTASSISLGNTDGILSCGVGDPSGGFGRYGNLASVTPEGGAALTVTANGKVGGDISLLTSTIATLGGGGLSVTSEYGTMDFGSQDLFGTTGRDVGFGIFTTGGGNVNVTALGDINIDGSRIATYNGGKITVLSQQGNVNVGNGGTSFISVPVYFVDDGVSGVYAEQVFGSGIVANTLVDPKQVPGAATIPGDIDVRTPQGSIIASSGGITQEALNGNISGGPMITLIAGTDLVAATATTPAVPGFVGNIDLGNSGVIGGTVNLKANGNITGLIISRQDSTIDAAASFSGTVLSGGSANLSAGGSISGTVVGIGGVNATGGQGVTATLLGQNVSVGGAAATSTLGTSATASATSQAAAQQANADAQQQVASNPASDDDDLKKKAKGPTLRRMVGRVTVLLP